MPSDTERASVPASIAQSFTEGDPVHNWLLHEHWLDVIQRQDLNWTLFSHPLDVTFDQKFAAFKRGLNEKQAATKSQM